jgi:hypothetical protein
MDQYGHMVNQYEPLLFSYAITAGNHRCPCSGGELPLEATFRDCEQSTKCVGATCRLSPGDGCDPHKTA